MICLLSVCVVNDIHFHLFMSPTFSTKVSMYIENIMHTNTVAPRRVNDSQETYVLVETNVNIKVHGYGEVVLP